ncbi:SH3 domain-containing protein [Novispirillum sp. DQ9]|uniref:SH3 domain-containing protein n=1 Tax=Novispirillum sp. DQ9 TaxID=3398612 RepID=UPI003C7D6E26
MTRLLSVVILAGAVALASLGDVASAAAQSSGLPLPRFVSLRSDQVNMRSGPGVRYPVDWVYLRRNLPVEVIAEFDTWRKIRDAEGAEGWVHQSMLAGRRTVQVITNRAPLRRTADELGAPAALVEAGVVGRLVQCPTGSVFCRVEINGVQGWLKREEFWGVYKAEFVE